MVGRRPRRRDDGAVAVESALVLSFILAPLMLGVLTYGYYFWQAQRVPLLDPNIDQSGLVGEICESQLVGRVLDTVRTAVENVDDANALPVPVNGITATVLDFVPGTLGVDVRVSITTNLGSVLPLPNGGNVTNDVLLRLQNVKVKTGC